MYSYKEKLFTYKNISPQLRKNLMKACVWSITLYGCETWIIGDTESRRLEAFKAWFHTRMMTISWVDRVTNEEVLIRTGEKRS
jgi:hypothetical protein